MSQTLALFIDAYRDLNSRKLFWVTLTLSGVIVILFAMVGINANGLTFVTLKIPIFAPEYWYKLVFSKVVDVWVAWGAVILALISTAGVFPDFMAGGSIDLFVSKPLGRFRLFLTKYATGLFFTFLQVSVFTLSTFIVYGLRGHEWHPEVLLIIPLVLCLYSYLFAIAVLIGVLTRSTITALLLTVVVWLVFFIINWGEHQLFKARVSQSYTYQTMEEQARDAQKRIDDLKQNPSITNAFGPREARLSREREEYLTQAATARAMNDKLAPWHRAFFGVSSVVPKTGETIGLLDRYLFTESDLEYRSGFDKKKMRVFIRSEDQEDQMIRRLDVAQDAELEAMKASRHRSAAWILGSSFAFEAVVVALAAWIFCRRDY